MAMAEASNEGALIEDHPRLALLREFLDTFYTLADARMAHIDGHAIAHVWAPYCKEHGIPVQTSNRLYGDLRYFGFIVRLGTGHRQTIYGIKEKPHVRAELARLEAGWPEVAANAAEEKVESQAVVRAREAIRDTIVIETELATEALMTVVDIMRNCPDAGRRLQAAGMIMERTIQKVPVRAIEEEVVEEAVIEVEVIDRMSLDEVEAVLKGRMRPSD